MQKKLLLVGALIVLGIVILSGCTVPPYCGDGVCNGTETQYNCSQDCGKPVQAGTLNVYVTDNSTGNPISGALVEVSEIVLEGPTTGWGSYTDDYGWAVFKGVPSGKDYNISVSAQGYNAMSKQAKMPEGSYWEYEEDFPLEPVSSSYCPNAACETEENYFNCAQDCTFSGTGVYVMKIRQAFSVDGNGIYEGKKLALVFEAVVINGVTNEYEANWGLYDGSTLIVIKQVPSGANFKDHFWDYYQNYNNQLTQDEVGLNVQTNEYYAVLRSTQTLELRDGQVFPYDSTQTMNPAWKAYLTSSASGILGISIKNNWGYNQVKSESTTSKLVLGAGDKINLADYAKIDYFGIIGPTEPSTIGIGGGQNTITFTDTKGVQRLIPLVISLGSGTSTFTIGNQTFLVDVNEGIEKIRYWRKPHLTETSPWGNPSGVNGVDRFDVPLYDKNVNTLTTIKFMVDPDIPTVNYYIGADKTTNQYWLFLSSQKFSVKKGTGTGFLLFSRTYMTGTNSMLYYLPDQATYNVLTQAMFPVPPNEGDNNAFTALFYVDDGSSVQVFVDTATSSLSNSTDGKTRYAWYKGVEAYDANQGIGLNEYATAQSTRLMQSYTLFGTKLSVNKGALNAQIPETQTPATTSISTPSTAQIEENYILKPSDSPVGYNHILTQNANYKETMDIISKASVQTIADGKNPGDIVLQINPNGITCKMDYNSPIILGTNTGQTITFMGKNYTVLEATTTRLLLEEK